MKTLTKILIVEHDPVDLELIGNELKQGGIDFISEIVQNEQDYINALKNFLPDIILSDYTFPAFAGPEAFKIRGRLAPDTPFIFVSGSIGEENSIEFIKNGVTDFTLKESLFTLSTKVKRALKAAREKEQKKETEQALIKSEKRLTRAQQLAQMGSWEIDLINNVRTWSDGMFKIYGIDNNKQPSAELFLSFVHPTVRELTTDRKLQSADIGGEPSFNFQFIREDGQKRFGYSEYRFEFDKHHKPVKMFGTVQDITEIKKADENLQENERLYRALIEKGADMKTLSSKEGKILYSSPSVTAALGYSSEEFSHKYPSDLIHPEDLESYLEKRNELIKTPGKSFSFQQRRAHKNGNWIWCEGIITNMLHEPAIKAMVSNFRDITEKKIAEQQQEFDKNNLNALINNTTDLMWSVDKDFKLITCNQPFIDMIKYMSGEIVEAGYNVLSIFPPEQLERYRLFYERAFAGESFKEIEHSTHPVEFWTVISFHPINNGNEIIGTACHSRDITEIKKSEQLLSKSESFNRGVLNSLNAHIAVIDVSGTIVAVNESWKKFALENGETTLQRTGVGSNYFDVCEQSARNGDEIAAEVLTGLKDVLNEKSKLFNIEYPCHSPDEQRWFILRALKFDGNEGMIVVSHINITERKLAEDKLIITSNELQHALNDLNKIMDSSLDVICAVDAKGNFLKVSAASETVWGYKPEELIGKPLINFVYHEDNEKTRLTAGNVMSGSNQNHFENRYVRKDGSLVPIEWTARWDAKDKIRYGVARDVSEKKRLEKAIETERQRFYALFSEAPSSMGVLTGPDHVFEIVNPLYLQLIGKKDIIGKPIKEVLPEIVEQGFIEILNGVYQTGKSFSANEMLIKLDMQGNGKLIDHYLNFIYQAHRTNDGKTDGILFFAIDVTEQVLSRKKIEESEARLKEAQAIAHTGSWQIYLDNKIHTWSDELYKIFGVTKDEIKPGTEVLLSFIHPEDRNFAQKEIADALETLKSGTSNFRFIRKDGIMKHGYIEWKFEFDKNNKPIRLYGIVQDITEQKKAKEVLNDLTERLLLATNSVNIGIWDWDIPNNNLIWDENMYKIFSVPPDKFSGAFEAWSTAVHPDDLSQALAEVQAAIDGTEDFHTSFRILWPDREVHYIEGHATILRDVNGKALRMIGINRDITEQKLGEILIRESEARLAEAQAVAKVGSWVTDLLTLNVIWSAETFRIFELDPDNFRSSHPAFMEYVHPDDRAKVDAAFTISFDKDTTNSIEHRIITPGGVIKVVEERWNISRDKKGIPMQAVGTCQDITERKKAEAELRITNERLSFHLENTPLGFIEWDNQMHLKSWSKQAEEIFGWTAQEFIEKQMNGYNQVYIDDQPWVIKIAEQLIKGEVVRNKVQHRNYRNDGTVIWCEWFNSVLKDEEGRVISIMSLVQNITERKNAEAERQKITDDLILRNKDLEQFSYMVSHNLRLPVANIVGYADVLINDDIDESLRSEFMDSMLESVKNLDNVVTDLSEVLQVKREINEKKETVIFSNLVGNIRDSIYNIIEKEKVKINSDFAAVKSVTTLKSYMYSIFYNLISNSIKYRQKDVSPVIEIKSRLEGNKMILTFKDNGSGIDLTKNKDAVFGMYKRFHSLVEGKGMGLYMVKTQVEALGGKISIKSEVNKGTEFTIEFEQQQLN